MTELNLLPYSFREKRKRRLFYQNVIGIIIIFLCVMFISLYYPLNELSGLKKQADSLKRQVDSYQHIIIESNNLRKQIDELNSYINKVTALTSNRIIVVDKIRGLQAYIPQDIYFNSLNYNSDVITINGVTPNYQSISEFTANLQMSQNYMDTKITNINYDKAEKSYTFSIIIK